MMTCLFACNVDCCTQYILYFACSSSYAGDFPTPLFELRSNYRILHHSQRRCVTHGDLQRNSLKLLGIMVLNVEVFKYCERDRPLTELLYGHNIDDTLDTMSSMYAVESRVQGNQNKTGGDSSFPLVQ